MKKRSAPTRTAPGQQPAAPAKKWDPNFYETKHAVVFKAAADLVIDTSSLAAHQLRQKIEDAFGDAEHRTMQVTVQSFGFKYGLPLDADLVADVRFLPNPHWVPELRPRTGLDEIRRAQQGGGMGAMMGIGKSKARRYDQEASTKVSFEDVAGIDAIALGQFARREETSFIRRVKDGPDQLPASWVQPSLRLRYAAFQC